MKYDFVAIPDADVPQAAEPVFQHVVMTYASEVNKTVGVWRAVPDDLLDFKPREKTNPIRTIFTHQLLSERRFFAEFAGLNEPAAEELLPAGKANPASAKTLEELLGELGQVFGRLNKWRLRWKEQNATTEADLIRLAEQVLAEPCTGTVVEGHSH
jgi:hypothetical protein